jgi:cobalt-precorrin-5B (C1)-methyltransferase
VSTHEPPLSPEVARAKGLRTGWTTGTCASAAAKAATTWLVAGQPPTEIDVALPSGRRVSFAVADVDTSRPHRCAVIKDAGDDPDVTHGAHLTADVTWLDPDGVLPLGPGGTHPAATADPGATPDPAAPNTAAATAGPDAIARAGDHISAAGTADSARGPSAAAVPVPDASAGALATPTDGTATSASEAGGPRPAEVPAKGANAGASGPGSVGFPATGANANGLTVSAGGAATSGRGADEPGVAEVPGTGDLSAAGGGGGWAVVTVDGVTLVGGEGVGTVTLPGLGLEVGGPAINPVPRRMISAAVREVTDRPVLVTLSVPGGEAMAAKTSNDRLGIVGGISILGTTGVVKPFSTASYRASVVQQVDVAAAQGQQHMALSTGSRSDQAAQRLLPELDPVCFVEVGDFTGIALRRAAGSGIDRITWVGMAGKIAKLAAGVLMTHYRRSKVDGEMLAEVARATDAPAAVVEAATATATARHFAEVCLDHGAFAPLAELCRRAAVACAAHVDGALAVEVIMVDFAGEEVLARA